MTLSLLRSSTSSAQTLSSIMTRSCISVSVLPSTTRQFTNTPTLNAKSPPGRGKDALRKARRQKLLDQKRMARLSRKVGNDAAVLAAQTAPLAMTQKQREEKREQEKRAEELSIENAGNVLRAHSISRPLQSYELHIVTTVSSHQSNALRGRLSLPKDPRTKGEHIIIFCEEGSETYDEILRISKELGIIVNTNTVTESPSSEVASSSSSSTSSPSGDVSQTTITIGGQSLIESISSNRFSANFTKVLSTSSILPIVSRTLARSLGPKGLMPSVKRGTVASTPKEFEVSIRDAKGSMDWRGDRNGVVRGKCGRLDFGNEDLKKNVRAILEAVVDRVSSGMGQNSGSTGKSGGGGQDYSNVQQVKVFNEASLMAKKSPGQLKKARSIIKQVHLSSTQGPGIRLNLDEVLG